MVCITDVYLLNKDIRAFERRAAFLDARIAARDVNAGGAAYDRAERETLRRLLSQIQEKGQPCDPPNAMQPAHSQSWPDKGRRDAFRLSTPNWRVAYRGNSHPKPWTATQGEDIDTAVFIEAETFRELDALVVEKSASA